MKILKLLVENPPEKARKAQQDLTYRFPSSQPLSMWLRDAVILNIKFMVDSVLNKGEGAVVAWGTDDTIKKAGHKVCGSKSNHITDRIVIWIKILMMQMSH